MPQSICIPILETQREIWEELGSGGVKSGSRCFLDLVGSAGSLWTVRGGEERAVLGHSNSLSFP